MFHNLIISFLFLISIFDTPCKEFQRGEFIYDDPSYAGIKIKRGRRFQIESLGDTLKVKYKIIRPDECRFNLIPLFSYYKGKRTKLLPDTIFVEFLFKDEYNSYRYLAKSSNKTVCATLNKTK